MPFMPLLHGVRLKIFVHGLARDLQTAPNELLMNSIFHEFILYFRRWLYRYLKLGKR